LIPDSYIQDLLARIDIVEVVGRHVQLRKGGANLLGLCPFHNEKSPSFTVSPSKQFYHCFGCGEHGSAITFLMKHTGASFVEAVHALSGTIGMVVPEAERSVHQQAHVAQRKSQVARHTRALDCAQALYVEQLRTSSEAIRYLKQRGLTGQIAKRFGLGWSGRDRQTLATVFDDYNDPVLVEAGLVIEAEDGRRYDRFRERIIFPIRNARGALIGFGGRLIGPGEPKYLNSPETPVFSKGQELYGLWEGRQAIRTAGQVIVVEGYMDVVGLAQQGVGNAVATLGTATTPDHITKLLRASDKIIFSFDGDMAGRKAAWRALLACLPVLRDDITIRFLFLPAEHDPDSYVRACGAAAFRACLAESDALSRFLLDELADRHNLKEAEGRASCLHESKPLIALIPACALRLQIERELARLVHLMPEELTRLLTQAQGVQRASAQTYLPPDLPSARAGSVPSEPASGSFATGDSARFDAIADGNWESVGLPSRWQPVSDSEAGTPLQASTSDPGAWSDRLQGNWSDSPTDAHDGERRSPSNQTPSKRGQGKGRWRDDPPQGVLEARRPVPTLARRLLRLLLAHPKLVDSMGDEQLEVIDKGPHLSLVRDLIMLAQVTGARHIGALLEAAEPASDLHLLLRSTRADVMSEEALPDPQAEWDDALRRIEFDTLTAEMHALAATGLSDDAARLRYQALWQRKSILQQASNRDLR
jgi:DNA primase